MMSKSGVVGKVKYEDIEVLFQTNLPSPAEIETLCDAYMTEVVYKRHVKELQQWGCMAGWKKMFIQQPTLTMTEESILYNGLSAFFKAEQYFNEQNFDYYKDMFYASQNIRKVLKIKRIACMSKNNVYAEEHYLEALRDVINDLDYYENILNYFKTDI